mmetsp:Transcript_22422/g.62742  ORF Transcript_22422/g.62742 Transcript_22422/m.62742 type:complete len:248 (-) Transcript_22422:168-911(-)
MRELLSVVSHTEGGRAVRPDYGETAKGRDRRAGLNGRLAPQRLPAPRLRPLRPPAVAGAATAAQHVAEAAACGDAARRVPGEPRCRSERSATTSRVTRRVGGHVVLVAQRCTFAWSTEHLFRGSQASAATGARPTALPRCAAGGEALCHFAPCEGEGDAEGRFATDALATGEGPRLLALVLRPRARSAGPIAVARTCRGRSRSRRAAQGAACGRLVLAAAEEAGGRGRGSGRGFSRRWSSCVEGTQP